MTASVFTDNFKTILVLMICLMSTITAVAQSKPELYVATGHTGSVENILFTPDNKLMVSVGFYTVKVWDVATGEELRTITDTAGEHINSISLSPDGRTLATSHLGVGIKRWDIFTGKLLGKLCGPDICGSMTVLYSPDGKLIATGSRLIDGVTGETVRTLSKNNSYEPDAFAFSADGKTLAGGNYERSISIWDVASGREIRLVEGLYDRMDKLAFSPDGKYVAGSGYGGKIEICDATTGSKMFTLDGDPIGVISIKFSPNGLILYSTGHSDNKLIGWDVRTGKQLFSDEAGRSSVSSFAFSPDYSILAIGCPDDINLYSLSKGGVYLRSMASNVDSTTAVAFGATNEMIAGASGTAVRVWAASDGRTAVSFDAVGLAYNLVFRQDGAVVSASDGYESRGTESVTIWDPLSGPSKKIFDKDYLEFHSYTKAFALSSDGKTLASIRGNEQDIRVWDIASGSLIKILPAAHDDINEMVFDKSGTVLASSSGDYNNKKAGETQLWNVPAGKKIRTIGFEPDAGNPGDFDYPAATAISPDGIKIAVIDSLVNYPELKNLLRVQNVKTGAELASIRIKSMLPKLAFNPSGSNLAISDRDGSIRLWDMRPGSQMRTFKASTVPISSLSFSPDGSLLAVGDSQGSVTLIDVNSGLTLISLIGVGTNDWLAITPDGLFDGSPRAWKVVKWRFSQALYEILPVETFFSDYYHPGLLDEVLSGKRPTAPRDITNKDRRQAKLAISLVDGQPGANTFANRQARVKVSVTDAPAGAKDVRLFRNGSLVKVWHGDVLIGKQSSSLEATIPLVAGENNLTAYAFNRDNVKSNDANLTVFGADSLKRKGTAYVLAVGVNEYANRQYNLTYAVPDAQDFSAELSRQQQKLGNFDHIEVIPLNDKDATKANILKSLSDISAKIQPEDSLTIYFAGHGTAQQNRFYLIPHDLGYTGSRDNLSTAGLQTILAHSISDEELEAAVEGIDTGQMLLVIDACNSGQALEAEEKRRGPMNSKGLAQLAYEKGMYILTAAQSYQAAKEAAKLGHGFLTYALVEEGLKTNAADREPKDGQVLVREWLDYATMRVPQMQQEDIKTRELKREKANTSTTAVSVNVQRPRVFYRRETEPHPLVIARP